MAHPQPYDVWIELDLAWVEVCDCVLRLGGYSIGADSEVRHALRLGIPVYNSIDELKLNNIEDV